MWSKKVVPLAMNALEKWGPHMASQIQEPLRAFKVAKVMLIEVQPARMIDPRVLVNYP